MSHGTPLLGAIARPQLPPERILSVGRAAEEAGLEELWVWEDSFYEGGIAMAGALLGATRRLRVGIGVMPFPLRNVALAAMEIAALDRAFPGRFVAGLGHGVQEWMRQAGVRPRSVLTLEREYVAALRVLLAGETVTAHGEYVRLDGVRLEWPPSTTPALHLAATGPRSLETSGEVGDGTILVSSTTLDDFASARELVARGREASGRGGEHVFTIFLTPAGRDAAATAELVRRWHAAGAQRVVLEPHEHEGDPEGFVRFVAADVAPLVRGS
ncbi:LLM class flavin-dependent oxidoreductase [Herbiconiux sp. SYSU D00978]|uniref:LLM class flavin-dependent oxidoreductase n=1 Tax=Herbiconiux sp. SYSU D00978 TaxID=2812562 RepID=UPI001A95F4BD|nr:LLM class flavin-dependent oxidoreductase [Herbiconiux sp. SYSU D00978]